MPNTRGQTVGGRVARLGTKGGSFTQPGFINFWLGKSRGIFTQFMSSLCLVFTASLLHISYLKNHYLYPFSTKLLTKVT